MSGSSACRLPLTTGGLCVRPGERPAWIDASAHRAMWGEWRALAVDRGLPIDVILALLLEYELVCRELDAARVERSPLERINRASVLTTRLAPTPELREWVSQLTAGVAPLVSDELPDVALPQRLVHRSEPKLQAAAWQRPERLDAAARCDAEAARHGMTLEAWALRTALMHCAIDRS